MKFVMLRAPIKQTVVEWEGQIAKNDSAYEDIETATDYWTVFANEMLRYFDEVEIWYGENSEHPRGFFCHSTGLIERYFREDYVSTEIEKVPDVLFVRGDHKEYYPVIERFTGSKLVYYPSGHYYCPNTKFPWDLCFVEDPRQLKEVKEKTNAETALFKKSCVDKYFTFWNCEKKYDVCFIGGAAEYKGKRILLLKDILDALDRKISVLVLGLKSKKLEEEFKDYPVHFQGFVNRKMIGNYMSKCRMGLVLATVKGNGSPRVIQEFLAAGLPIVVSDKTVYSDYYINDRTGYVAYGDSKLPWTIMKCLEDTNKFDTRRYFLEELLMEDSVENFISCLERLYI